MTLRPRVMPDRNTGGILRVTSYTSICAGASNVNVTRTQGQEMRRTAWADGDPSRRSLTNQSNIDRLTIMQRVRNELSLDSPQHCSDGSHGESLRAKDEKRQSSKHVSSVEVAIRKEED